MAFSFNSTTDNKSLMNIIGVSVIVALLGFGTYMLFFAPEPFVEVIAPPELESISELSKIDLEGTNFADSGLYQSLEEKVPEVETGEAGRENPFAPF